MSNLMQRVAHHYSLPHLYCMLHDSTWRHISDLPPQNISPAGSVKHVGGSRPVQALRRLRQSSKKTGKEQIPETQSVVSGATLQHL